MCSRCSVAAAAAAACSISAFLLLYCLTRALLLPVRYDAINDSEFVNFAAPV